MEVDGMYENTPWERLALHAPWIGLAVIGAAIIYFLVTRARARAMHDDDAILFKDMGDHFARQLGALGTCLMSLGILFTKYWRPAHDAYPTKFGHGAIRLAGVAVLIGVVVWALWRRQIRMSATFALLTATVSIAAAISAFSHTIIAEGQVTAMVLPVGYVVAAIAAELIAAIVFQFGVWDPDTHDLVSLAAFLAGAWFMSDKLPVVQFAADSSVYPVMGGLYIVALGRLARVWALPIWAMGIGAVAAMAIGYMLGLQYGIAIAAVGLSISGSTGRLRRTSEEFLPQH